MHLKSLFRYPLIANFNYRPFFNKWAKDYLLAIFFFVLGGLIALFFYQKIGYTFFYQNFVPEAILWACGHEFLFPKRPITELIPFLNGQVLSFDCKTLPTLNLYNTTSEFAGVQPYLTWSVALLWKWFGVNYQALSPLIFALWGAYTAGIYLLFRQFCNKWIACLAALFICLSPVMVHMIGSLRDFSKAPFIIWALFLLMRTIKQPTNEGFKAYISPMMAGAIAGLGMGFRSDLYFLLPIGSIFLIIGFCNPQIKTAIGQIFSRVKIGVTFVAAFIIFASPVLKNGGPGGVGGVFIMQGMSEPFRKNLKLEPAGYTTGWAYSDELTLSSIAASERQKDPEKWDQKEMAGIPGISISQSMHLGTPNLFQWADLFIGDFATQAIKSFTWIAGFPLYISKSGYALINPFLNSSAEGIIYNAYQKLHHPIILLITLIGFLLLLFNSYLTSKSESIALGFLFIFLGAYPGIQFEFRHFFYLEFIWVLFLIYFFTLFKSSKKISKLCHFLLWVTLTLFVLFTGYISLLKYQSYALSKEIVNLIQLPRIQIFPPEKSTDTKGMFLKIDIPKEYMDLINSPYDSMTPDLAFIGSEWDVRSGAMRYLLSATGEECAPKRITVNLSYKHTLKTWQPLDTTMFLMEQNGTQEKGVIFTGFYRPTQYFQGINIVSESKGCTFKVEAINGDSRLPFTFSGYLQSNQLHGPLFKKLSSFW